MRKAQEMLLEKIKNEGRITGEVVKADTFINHQVDIKLFRIMAEDMAEHFKDAGITKILTAETSGITIAHPLAEILDVPYIFAKKKRPITMEKCFQADSYSFTKQEETTLFVSKEVISYKDTILYADDFYAKGNTLKAVKEIMKQSGAKLAGAAVIIDKQGVEDVYSILTMAEIKRELGI
jgi:xanthine phosphoribosyltransferase